MDMSDWHDSDPPGDIDPAYSAHSSLREKIIEHLFVGELLRTLWRKGARRVELLRAEVDAGGYDLVLECNGIIRHIQLKSSYRGAKTSRVNINVGLQQKARGCVIWIMFDPHAMEIGPFLWLGNPPDQPAPSFFYATGAKRDWAELQCQPFNDQQAAACVQNKTPAKISPLRFFNTSAYG